MRPAFGVVKNNLWILIIIKNGGTIRKDILKFGKIGKERAACLFKVIKENCFIGLFENLIKFPGKYTCISLCH